MASTIEGVSEARGKCRIRWDEDTSGGKRNRKTKVLDIPYTPTGIKKAAKVRQQYIKAYHRGELSDERGKPPTFGNLAQIRLNTAKLSPETRRTQKIWLQNYWMPHFADTPITTIQYDDLLDKFAGVLASDLKPKSIKHIFSAGSQVFEIAIKSKWRTDNPAKLISNDIKLDIKTVDPFTRDERDQLLDWLSPNPSQYLYYALRFYQGMRPSEVIALRTTDYKNGMFYITKGRVRGEESAKTKNGKDREMQAHPFIINLLKERPRHIHSDHILVNEFGNAYANTSNLSKSLTKAMKATGIRHRSPYNARHTCATMMLEAGMKPGYCASVLGHSLQMFFTIYAVFLNKEESKAQAKIWNEVL